MLVLLNGPPASGKSTLAARWVEERPLALNLDLDRLWTMLGGWAADLTATGLAARELALAMARVQLDAGRDVIVPQYLGRPGFIDQLAAVGGSGFRHVVLLPPFEVVSARFHARTGHPVAAAGQANFSGPDELRTMYDRLVALARSRPDAEVVELADEPVDAVLAKLRSRL